MIKRENKIKKPIFDSANLFLVLIIINIFLHYLLPIKQIIFPPYIYIGIILFVLGWVPNIWMGLYFRKIGTSISANQIPKKLVTSGLFKISRNPNYLGMIIALIGEAVFLGSLITFIIPIIFAILITKINIPFEEKNLEKAFGKNYFNYKKQVRRWL
jgi:protein-S-isoprenylcysteine O-methyltransferase Ste14